jgi:hypothetical protein
MPDQVNQQMMNDDGTPIYCFVGIARGSFGKNFFSSLYQWDEEFMGYAGVQSHPVCIKATAKEAKRLSEEWALCEEIPLMRDGEILHPVEGFSVKEREKMVKNGFDDPSNTHYCSYPFHAFVKSKKDADSYMAFVQKDTAIFWDSGKLIPIWSLRIPLIQEMLNEVAAELKQ